MLTPENVFLAVKPVDMRHAIDTLTQYVQDELKSAWHEGAAFVFTSKSRSRIKVLRWDKHGVWLCVRRLHKGHFRWPRANEAAWSLTPDEFSWLVSGVAVQEQVAGWQSPPPDPLYPVVYPDRFVAKVRQDGSVINKAVFRAPGINTEGHRELPGVWLEENEGAKFLLSVLTELKKRGLEDILIACVDGLKGFPDAINSAYPQTRVQLRVVHMSRGKTTKPSRVT